jgi:hypothetical protein
MNYPSQDHNVEQEKQALHQKKVASFAESGLNTPYNYDEFTPEKVLPLLNFEKSPSVGQPAPDFPLWRLNGEEVKLSDIWSSQSYTIVEFGSFT